MCLGRHGLALAQGDHWVCVQRRPILKPGYGAFCFDTHEETPYRLWTSIGFYVEWVGREAMSEAGFGLVIANSTARVGGLKPWGDGDHRPTGDIHTNASSSVYC